MQIYTQAGKALVYGGKVVSRQTETWTLNEIIDTSTYFSYNVNFVSNGVDFVRIMCSGVPELDYYYADGGGQTAVRPYFNGAWNEPKYKTITLESPATGDFLVWLQTNAIKQ